MEEIETIYFLIHLFLKASKLAEAMTHCDCSTCIRLFFEYTPMLGIL
jgi:hypothetical protein